MEKDAGQIFRELKEDITAYAESKFELFKLSSYEKVGHVAGLLTYGLILISLALFALLFIFISAGYFLGEMFHSIGLGFACVAGLYLIIILIVIIMKRRIKTKVLNEIIEALTANDEKENGDNS
ncbi:MAG: phage holin family protein [Tannerellaceae bacterium]|jgi:tetrahydromethanopterin S-methyltransferase subunit E|nr:phage holin family protein [Tannerellaceae bacterium]